MADDFQVKRQSPAFDSRYGNRTNGL